MSEEKFTAYSIAVERVMDAPRNKVDEVIVNFLYGASPIDVVWWNQNFPPNDPTTLQLLPVPWLQPMLKCPAPNQVFSMARQTMKSASIQFMARAYAYTFSHYLRQLWVSPTAQQRDLQLERLAPMMGEFHFSKLAIELGMERTVEEDEKDPPFHVLFLDEAQNLDGAEVMELEALARPKAQRYFGTPNTKDSVLQFRWDHSSQNEWLVPCDSCGGGESRTWNVLDDGNISEQGLACQRCHQVIDWAEGQWVERYRDREWTGWHVSQLMCVEPVGWMPWAGILHKRDHYTEQQFQNEVLAQPFPQY